MKPCALALVLAGLAAPVAADTAAGKAIYDRYCATCHGAAGQGDGPTARIITIPPADLSTLAAGNGGDFPTSRVIRRIDGRDVVIAHGSPMPIYGAFFEGALRDSVDTDAGVMEVSGPVLELLDYLQALQR